MPAKRSWSRTASGCRFSWPSVLSQVASDIETEQVAEARRRYNSLARETQRHRTRGEVARFFDGLTLLDPGVVPVQRWHPASDLEARAKSSMWCGVARR